MEITCRKTDEGVVVSCDCWEVTHAAKSGGAWSSVVFGRGSGKNLLARPASAMVRFCEPDAEGGQNPRFFRYREDLDGEAALDATEDGEGGVAVVSEGLFRDESGADVGLRFRRTVRYTRWGRADSELDITAERPVDGVVEVCGLEMLLRPGMDRAFVTHHPMLEAASAPGRGWHEIPRDSYTCRYMPAQVIVFEEDVEGIELYGPSDPSEWDLSGYDGAGLYELRPEADGTTYVALNAYCNAFRRVPITLEGRHSLHVIFGLPFVKEREAVFSTVFHAGAGSVWPSDDDLEEAASAGIRLIRFHNDYREGGPFWHDGMYPPYDDEGMAHVRRIVETGHRLGMKLVPYVSLKEFHPESPGYDENLSAWQRKEGLDGHVTHTWTGSGEFGALMCMRSGWLDFRKKACDIMLDDVPWDGLYFDWTSFYPCCHKGHDAELWHHDTEEYLDFIVWARERVGDDGFLFIHNSSHPSLIAENVADLIFNGEHDGAYRPDAWHHECRLVPVAPRQVAVWGRTGDEASLLAMSGMLQGHPTCITVPMRRKDRPRHQESVAKAFAELRLFCAEDLSGYRFARASEMPVETGAEDVYASLHWKPGTALVYLGNCSGKAAAGRLATDLAARGVGEGPLEWELVSADGAGAEASGSVTAAELASGGLEYDLGPWSSALYRIRARG